MSNKKATTLRVIVEIIFLALFLFLLRNKDLQRWFLIFGIGLLGAIFLGRVYCGWICPMETLFRPINWLYSKLKIKRLKTPAVFKNNIFRWTVLVLFVMLMVAVKAFRIRMNLLLYITAFSVLVTLVFEEEFWHRYICPFGTLLSIFSRNPLFGMRVEKTSCVSCGICQRVCPVSAIEKEDDGMKIDTSECLVCLKCKEKCPKTSITYSRSK
ncbi:MAG: 4Fe-4S binding protein [Mesotoga sp.]|uniref:4Fe-4S binding protein n=1 Tax=unclassified Mesotoga TaxID=1184398 RepID=UPI000EF2469F|nr:MULTISPECIES: 4Fe-4S binding protein [unclassified Mesotoga]MDI9367064.1 4Fe-4S binding protein [Thermotogota bacterium]MDD2333373.1 4Fe-4S binding protein [Mesotoga sp.]MDD3681544.1 4Fe-4S binding protein [Mesotoga sp.]MDD4208337.1 4Fe-4S binding protein [Mesotoga sp.]MDD5683918.1 4Fe-4S binding protein [Mesotoga sp.]